MKQLNLTILNINHCCNYDSVYVELKQFLKRIAFIDSYYNIVLNVVVRRANNTSSLLINNLSIKPSGFYLIFKGINNKLDLIDIHSTYSITFSISYSINRKYIYGFIFMALISLIIFLIIFYLSDCIINNSVLIYKETYFTLSNTSTNNINCLDNSLDNVISVKKRNFSIFNTFIELFNRSNSIYKHFPNYFINDKTNLSVSSLISIATEVQDQHLISNSIVDEAVSMTINKNYANVRYDNYKYYCLLNDLSNIISEYIKSNK